MNSKNSNDKESKNVEYFISFESLKEELIKDAKKGVDSLNPKRTPEYVEQKIIEDMERGELEYPRKSHLYILIDNFTTEFNINFKDNPENLEKGYWNLSYLKGQTDKFRPIVLKEYDQNRKEQSERLKDNKIMVEKALQNYFQYIQLKKKEMSNNKKKVDKTFKMSKIKILLLGSQFKTFGEALVGEEIRKIRKILNNHIFEFKDETAIRRHEIALKISNFKPNIIHFSGHGTFDTGPLFNGDEDLMHTGFDFKQDLIEILRQSDKDLVKLIIFNVCESEKIAQEVAKFIDYTIGTNRKINDDCAPQFSKGFYSILESRKSIKESFDNGKRLYRYKYINLKQIKEPSPYSIFPETNDVDFGEFNNIFSNLLIINQSDSKTNPEKIQEILEQRKQRFKETIRKIRTNQFNMRITINSDKLFNLSNYESLIKFLNKQRDLLPILDASYGSLRIYDSFNVDSFGINSFSNNEDIGSSLEITKEGFIIYNLHINNSREIKILQVSYMAAHIIGLLYLCYRLYKWLNYSRNLDISIEIDNISDWLYLYQSEERILKKYKHEEFSIINLSFQLDEIKDGMRRYHILDMLIKELMTGYGCFQTHEMPNLSDFRRFYEGDDNDIITY